MRTSELHKGQPIFTFLAPPSANTTPFGQPTKRPFHKVIMPDASDLQELVLAMVRHDADGGRYVSDN